MQVNMICPFCGGQELRQAKNDLGYPHWKADGMKPTRMTHYRCEGCGFIASFAIPKGAVTGAK